jgi:hypothetical protein
MSAHGTLRETYAAAIQHDLVDVSDADRVVGVVRRPTRWFSAVVDENRPALAPPEDLLDSFKAEAEDLKMRGMCDEGAHNAAWENLRFDERYGEYLDESAEAEEAMADVVDRIRGGDDLVLVCFENTAKKRCHRTSLVERLEARLDER